MSFKIFNKNSILLVTGEGLVSGCNQFIDGIVLSREEVDYMIRHFGDVLDAMNKCQFGKQMTVITKMPEASFALEGEKLSITEMSVKSFTKSELVAFVDAVPELARWV